MERREEGGWVTRLSIKSAIRVISESSGRERIVKVEWSVLKDIWVEGKEEPSRSSFYSSGYTNHSPFTTPPIQISHPFPSFLSPFSDTFHRLNTCMELCEETSARSATGTHSQSSSTWWNIPLRWPILALYGSSSQLLFVEVYRVSRTPLKQGSHGSIECALWMVSTSSLLSTGHSVPFSLSAFLVSLSLSLRWSTWTMATLYEGTRKGEQEGEMGTEWH